MTPDRPLLVSILRNMGLAVPEVLVLRGRLVLMCVTFPMPLIVRTSPLTAV